MLGDRWGVTDAEVADHFDCDDHVADPTLRAWRGISVHAPAADVWPWITQLRLGPYSYDWIDNFGRRSPRELHELPAPRVGGPFTSAFGGRPVGTIIAVDPGVQLTGCIMGTFMSYRVTPVATSATRLVLKLVSKQHRVVAAAVCLGDLVMARKQLRTFAALAEWGVASGNSRPG